jgi:hypothetical protein
MRFQQFVCRRFIELNNDNLGSAQEKTILTRFMKHPPPWLNQATAFTLNNGTNRRILQGLQTPTFFKKLNNNSKNFSGCSSAI